MSSPDRELLPMETRWFIAEAFHQVRRQAHLANGQAVSHDRHDLVQPERSHSSCLASCSTTSPIRGASLVLVSHAAHQALHHKPSHHVASPLVTGTVTALQKSSASEIMSFPLNLATRQTIVYPSPVSRHPPTPHPRHTTRGARQVSDPNIAKPLITFCKKSASHPAHGRKRGPRCHRAGRCGKSGRSDRLAAT